MIQTLPLSSRQVHLQSKSIVPSILMTITYLYTIFRKHTKAEQETGGTQVDYFTL